MKRTTGVAAVLFAILIVFVSACGDDRAVEGGKAQGGQDAAPGGGFDAGRPPVEKDRDGDGVPDKDDGFPDDPAEHADNDGDGIGDKADTDDDNDGRTDVQEAGAGTDPKKADTDNDGIADGEDLFPLDPGEKIDTDKDGIGDAADPDDDNDGLSDAQEAALGTDPLEIDTDADGVPDATDRFPLDPAEKIDTDADGIGDVADPDDDGDGVADVDEIRSGTDPMKIDTDGDTVRDGADLFPLDPAEWADADADGVGDNKDAFPADPAASVDADSDGYPDEWNTGATPEEIAASNLVLDAFPGDAAEWVDTDLDRVGNNADLDDDNDGLTDVQELARGTNVLLADTDADGVLDGLDAFPTNVNEQIDTDLDGIGNNADLDDDNDGVADTLEVAQGTNVLAADTDGDGVRDGLDRFPLNPLESKDSDDDGSGDNEDPDDDNDNLTDAQEASRGTNPFKKDTDDDGHDDGDDAFPLDEAEFEDHDGDGVGDKTDAFKNDAAASVDTDKDGHPDAWNNGATAAQIAGSTLTLDTFPADPNEWKDTDLDGKGDNGDNCLSVPNSDQANFDLDLMGDACDLDDDNDNVLDVQDAFPKNPNRFIAFNTAVSLARLPGGTFSAANAINDLGEIVGQSDETGGVVSAVVWKAATPGTVEKLGGMVAGGFSAAYDININGTVAGEAQTASAVFTAVIWNVSPAGVVGPIELPKLDPTPGLWSAAYSVNDGGMVVGEAERMVGGVALDRAVLWILDPATGVPGNAMELGSLTGTSSSAYAINNQRMVAGEADDSNGTFHGMLWMVSPTGFIDQLVDLGGVGAMLSSAAFGVNSAGVVVGEAEDTDMLPRSVAWKIQGGQKQLVKLATVESAATAINENGFIGGFTTAAEAQTCVWDINFAAPTVCEPALAPAFSPADPDAHRVYDVNSQGQVVGIFRAADGDAAFLAGP